MNVIIEEVEETVVTVTVETVDPDYADYGARLAETEALAAEADRKADDALQQLANLPDPEVDPSSMGIDYVGGTPLSGPINTWRPGGLAMTTAPDANTGVVRYTGGRIQAGHGIEPNDVVTRQQLDDAQFNSGIQPDNIGTSPIVNSPRSLIMKSRNSSIELLANSNNQSNIIIGSVSARMIGQMHYNFIMASGSVNIEEGNEQAIISSNDCTIRGASGGGIAFGSSSNRAIIASSETTLTGRRRNAVAIASHRSVFEDWTDPSQLKWNIATIAARECRIKASNSYTIATGQGTVSNASAQIVMGTFNLDEPSVGVFSPNKKTFVVGNGQAGSYLPDGTPQDITRSNAFYVMHNGTAWVQNGFEIDNGGLIMRDTVTGTRYRLTIANGELNITPV